MTDTTPHRDGRKERSARTKAALLDACRVLFRNGTLRPQAAEIARVAGCSVRSVFQHFAAVDELYLETLKDPATTESVFLQLEPLSPRDLARVAVLGRLFNG